MSTIKKLEAVGLEVELEALLEKFLTTKGDDSSAGELRKAIDSTGLKSPTTMKVVGSLQRTNKLKPGLYKELVSLNKRLESGVAAGNDNLDNSSEVSSEDNKASGGEIVTDENDNVVELDPSDDGLELSPKHKEILRKREEKFRKSQLATETKIRERIKAQAEKRAQRKGMDLETLQAIKAKKDELTQLGESLKELREKIKVVRGELKDLRPKREKKTKAEDPKTKGKKSA